MNKRDLEPLGMDEIESRREHDLEPFQPEVVDEFAKNSNEFKEEFDYNMRHYSQRAMDLRLEIVRELLDSLSLDIQGKTVTVFGGYTGEFADRLRKLGCDVIFTDPIKEFVERAKEEEFESYTYFLEEMPGEIVGRTDLFATFECYYPFTGGLLEVHTVLRLLTARHGLIFAESERTRKEVDREVGRPVGRMKAHFRPFNKVYSTERKYRGESGGLRLYHIFQPEGRNREKIRIDCMAIKFLHDYFEEDKVEIGPETIRELSRNTDMSVEDWKESLRRILEINHWITPETLRRTEPYHWFNIFSKRYKVQFGQSKE